MTADVGLVFRPLGDKNFHESEILNIVTEYYTKLPEHMRQSFAPPDIITQIALNNYDPHFLFLLSNNSSKPLMERVKGLVIFA